MLNNKYLNLFCAKLVTKLTNRYKIDYKINWVPPRYRFCGFFDQISQTRLVLAVYCSITQEKADLTFSFRLSALNCPILSFVSFLFSLDPPIPFFWELIRESLSEGA